MKLKRYNEKDLIPLTVSVLDKLLFCYLVFTMDFLIEHVYPDLKGLVSINELDDATFEMLSSSDDELQMLTVETASVMEYAIFSIVNIYGLDLYDILCDERLQEMTNDLYWKIIYDDFPRPEDKDEHGDLDTKGSLDLYVSSLLNAACFLCYIITERTVDFNESFSTDKNFVGKIIEDYSNREHAAALEIIQDLGDVLKDTSEETFGLVYRIRYG